MFRAGLAKLKFLETQQRTPWKHKEKKTAIWPFLKQLVELGAISYLDRALAERLLHGALDNQAAAIFICHLLLAAKNGHLCVKIQETLLDPSVEALWQSNGEKPLDQAIVKMLHQMILEGAKTLPSHLLADPAASHPTPPLAPFCYAHQAFYLQRHWVLESQLLHHLNAHLLVMPELVLDEPSIASVVDQMSRANILLEEQAQAILKCGLHSLTLITGGPGTGKTYTAGQLIKVIWNSLTEDQRKNHQIILAAPTGKAAANLQKSLGHAAASIAGLPALQAKTLHALLGIKSLGASNKYPINQLSADIVVVDESSMIDVKMMGYLFQALKPGSRLILLGDQHQLPSIDAGSIFHDLIQLAKITPAIACSELKQCLRVELRSILELAHAVNQGSSDQALTLLKDSQNPGIGRFELDLTSTQVQKTFVEKMEKCFPSWVKEEIEPLAILNSFNSLRLLSPLRKGLFGVDELNQRILHQILRRSPAHGWLIIPIMVVTNDYKMDLFNGETGVLMRKLPHHGTSLEDYALFPARHPTDPPRRVSALLLPKHEYAYCLSVYKSQGSEFDTVVLVLPEGSECFGRAMLYTAITRAKRQIDIYASDAVIRTTIEQEGIRLSGLKQRFIGY